MAGNLVVELHDIFNGMTKELQFILVGIALILISILFKGVNGIAFVGFIGFVVLVIGIFKAGREANIW